MLCPKCKKNYLEIRTNKKGGKTLCCKDWKPIMAIKLDKKSWINSGECEFKIPFKNKLFGTLTEEGIKSLMKGEKIMNKAGLILQLDLNNPFFTRIDFPEKTEDFNF